MYQDWTRRHFLAFAPAAALTGPLAARSSLSGSPPAVDEHFPAQSYSLVRAVVAASHGNIEAVRELVEARPALAKAAIDWGFGDWESALGAAAHTGNREIAELLISKGARPTFFSAVMLGQLEVVRAFVAASPGIQRIAGPHTIPVITHARLGGEPAREVLAYLEELGDAGRRPAVPISEEERRGYLGTYRFGDGEQDTLRVYEGRFGMMIQRGESTARGLSHLGNHTFHPAGAEAVRVEFEVAGGTAQSVTIRDHDLMVVARR